MFQQHLKNLNKILGENSILILESGKEKQRTFSADYPFRVNNNFYYCSGFNEPDSILIVLSGKKNAQTILFCREKNEEKEMWQGFRFGPKLAKQEFKFNAAFPIHQFKNKLENYLKNKNNLFWQIGDNKILDDFIFQSIDNLKKQRGVVYPKNLKNAYDLFENLRVIKNQQEIILMQEAAKISDCGHIRAMQTVQPGMWEYQLEAELSYVFRQNGAAFEHAYAPIVAGGKNACVLHYNQNNCLLNSNELVLIDAGAEYQHYAADITRTFPISGKFTPEQKIIYEIVLNAQKIAIHSIKENVDFNQAHLNVIRFYVESLMDLKIIKKGNTDNAIEQGKWKNFYMHGTSHFLGLDVHDLGIYKNNEKEWIQFKKGMVLTVEPGLYLNEKHLPDHLKQFKNIGIRIEDNVLITEKGAQVYTHAPKEIAEIEHLMAQNKKSTVNNKKI